MVHAHEKLPGFYKALTPFINHCSSAGMPVNDRCSICPPSDDISTLFTSAGMQRYRKHFDLKNNFGISQAASIQPCLRMDDLNKVGDGQHLTFFYMLGTFGFGSNNYTEHCTLWDHIIRDLGVRIDYVRVHPKAPLEHYGIWAYLGYSIVKDSDCVWGIQGEATSYCCELMHCTGIDLEPDVEVGNLVNTNGNSVDVGFGFERILQVTGHHRLIDQSFVFNKNLDPISRDHVRALEALRETDIQPGDKGRDFVCRNLLRRVLRRQPDGALKDYNFYDWVAPERERMEQSLARANDAYPMHKNESAEWWHDSFGLTPDEVDKLTLPEADLLTTSIEDALKGRLAFKKVGNFLAADQIRNELTGRGVHVFDIKGTTKWSYKDASGIIE